MQSPEINISFACPSFAFSALSVDTPSKYQKRELSNIFFRDIVLLRQAKRQSRVVRVYFRLRLRSFKKL